MRPETWVLVGELRELAALLFTMPTLLCFPVNTQGRGSWKREELQSASKASALLFPDCRWHKPALEEINDPQSSKNSSRRTLTWFLQIEGPFLQPCPLMSPGWTRMRSVGGLGGCLGARQATVQWACLTCDLGGIEQSCPIRPFQGE